jgi:hypothetical protein
MKQFCLLLVCCFLLLANISRSDIPRTINYQGRLTDQNGNPLTDGIYGTTFTLYDATVNGTIMWSDTYSLQTKNGYFNIILGSNAAHPLNVNFNQPYYLGIAVSPDPEMMPRQPLNAVPYALNVANSSITSAKMKPTWSDKRTNVTYNLNGTTPVTISELTTTINVETPSLLFLVGNVLATITNTTNSGIIAYMEVDGTRVTEYSFFDSTMTVETPNTNLPMNSIYPVSAGNHTITVRANMEISSTTGDIIRGQLSTLVFAQ